MKYPLSFLLLLLISLGNAQAQFQPEPSSEVNVFMGTSGDHGQLSPAAGAPFGMMSIGPQTYPHLHAGYEYEARKFLGFTHNRFEGVGCTGSGGLILVKPFLQDDKEDLLKVKQEGSPGYYAVTFANGIEASFTASDKSGKHLYSFPSTKKSVYIDLGHALSNGFVQGGHQRHEKGISGWIEARTTCGVGRYKMFYYLQFDQKAVIEERSPQRLLLHFNDPSRELQINVGISSVSEDFAKANLDKESFESMRKRTKAQWDEQLGAIRVSGPEAERKLFYSLLYRTMQSPYRISEADGTYRGTDGKVRQSKYAYYNGWAVWDNYRTQLPLLSIIQPRIYQDIVRSLAALYENGKKDYATRTEPSNTVRTEHTIVVLLDAYRKGYQVDFKKIRDSLISENERLDFSKPDKALESSYDVWALAQVFRHLGEEEEYRYYLSKAAEYKRYWEKDFKDISKNDVDRMQARGLYQGTIWQYRWFVPFDVKGLIELCGGEETYRAQLMHFYQNDLYNHANEPDLQVPLMFNASTTPWMSQKWMRELAKDTVIQYYFNDNSRGIDPFVNRIYKNEPKAFIRTMDDDAGAMSAWYIFTAAGIHPALVGKPIYYLNVPLFERLEVSLPGGKQWKVEVKNFGNRNTYIAGVLRNGKPHLRNWITHEEIMEGGTLQITASDKPNTDFGKGNTYISSLHEW